MIADKPDRESIEMFSKLHGFSHTSHVEKFLMDFYVHGLIASEMDFCVRGGLCTPFYAKELDAARLSVDLDGFSAKSRKFLIKSVPRILAPHGIKCVPRKPREVRNLLQFDLKYTTPMGQHDKKSHVRIDVMHDANFEFSHHTIPMGHKLFFGETKNDVDALTRGSLIADKVASLAIGSGGYINEAKAPKQIHDIGHLLSCTENKDILEAITAFFVINEFKLSHRDTDITTTDTVKSVEKFVGGLLDINDGVSVKGQHIHDFEEFRDSYLSSNVKYTPHGLKSNILKVWAYSTFLRRVNEGSMKPEHAAHMLHKCLATHDMYASDPQKGNDDVEEMAEELSSRFPRIDVKGESPKNTYLLLEVAKISGLGHA